MSTLVWNRSLIEPLQQTRAAKGFAILSVVFSFFIVPAQYLARHETDEVRSMKKIALDLTLTTVCDSIPVQRQGAYLRENSYAAEGLSSPILNNDMVAANATLRIFWPCDIACTTEQGVLVGWRNSVLDLFVVTVLRGVEVCTGPNR